MDKNIFKILSVAFAVAAFNYFVNRLVGNADFPVNLVLMAFNVAFVYLLFNHVIKITNAALAAVWAVLMAFFLQVYAALIDWRNLDIFAGFLVYFVVFVASYYIFVIWQAGKKAKLAAAVFTLVAGFFLYLLGFDLLADSVRDDLNRML